MSCVNGDFRQVIFNGKNDFIFKIPNFCICDTIFERDYDEIKNNDENIIQKNIIIIISYRNDKNEMVEKKIDNITNKTNVLEVKNKFAELSGIDMENNKNRFFYIGLELLDDNLLWYDQVDNMSKIQCLVTLIE
jgi:hypothetical protein